MPLTEVEREAFGRRSLASCVRPSNSISRHPRRLLITTRRRQQPPPLGRAWEQVLMVMLLLHPPVCCYVSHLTYSWIAVSRSADLHTFSCISGALQRDRLSLDTESFRTVEDVSRGKKRRSSQVAFASCTVWTTASVARFYELKGIGFPRMFTYTRRPWAFETTDRD